MSFTRSYDLNVTVILQPHVTSNGSESAKLQGLIRRNPLGALMIQNHKEVMGEEGNKTGPVLRSEVAEIGDGGRVGIRRFGSLRSTVSGDNRLWRVVEGRRGGDAESICGRNVAGGSRNSRKKSGRVGCVSRILRGACESCFAKGPGVGTRESTQDTPNIIYGHE